MTFAPNEILQENLARGSMQGYQSVLSELGAADREDPCLQIEVLKLEIARLTQTQPRYGQQPEEAVIDPGQQRALFALTYRDRHVERGTQ